MVTLAPQERITVAFPENITSFLNRRAKRDNVSVPNVLTTIIAGVMEDEEDDIPDPYFTKKIMARLRSSRAQAERGELVEHELIEV
jgi:hypothetical protein